MLSTKNHLVRAAAVAALGVTALVGSMAPASAAQVAAPHLTVTAVAVAAKPNTNIKGSPAKWNPAELSVKPITGTCSFKNYSFTMTNQTKKSQTILYKTGSNPKKNLGTLKKSEQARLCGKGAKGSKTKFFIKGAKSVLTVTLS